MILAKFQYPINDCTGHNELDHVFDQIQAIMSYHRCIMFYLDRNDGFLLVYLVYLCYVSEIQNQLPIYRHSIGHYQYS